MKTTAMTDIWTVTGHRPPKLGGYSDNVFTNLIHLAHDALIEHKIEYVITGMALGWDQAVAQACVLYDISFHAVIPCEDQASKWPDVSKIRWNQLIMRAETVHSMGTVYTYNSMQDRNEYMVNKASNILALWDGSSSGTGNCIRYAEGKGIPITNLWDKWTGHNRENE
jgi:uncharacterized phage-like protein YoqJ